MINLMVLNKFLILTLSIKIEHESMSNYNSLN